MSEKRANWLADWLGEKSRSGSSGQAIGDATEAGPQGFAAIALDWDRPVQSGPLILGPLRTQTIQGKDELLVISSQCLLGQVMGDWCQCRSRGPREDSRV